MKPDRFKPALGALRFSAGMYLAEMGNQNGPTCRMCLHILTTSWTLTRKSICQQDKAAGCCAITKLCRAWDPNHYFAQVTSLYLPLFSPIMSITTRRQYWDYSLHDVEGNPLNISASFKNPCFLGHTWSFLSLFNETKSIVHYIREKQNKTKKNPTLNPKLFLHKEKL